MGTFKQDNLHPSPYLQANLISKLLFWWCNGLFSLGFNGPLEVCDLYQTLPTDRSQVLGDEMQLLWEEERRRRRTPSLGRTIRRQFGLQFILVGLLAFIEECVTKIAQPICLQYLIRYFSPKNEFTVLEGYALATGVVLGAAVYTFTHHPYFFGVQHIGMRIRVATCSLIYRKALKLSQASLGTTTIGQMVNLLSNDVNRFDQSTLFLHYLWIGPVQTAIVAGILWNMYGASSFAGLSVLLLFVPFQGYMGKLFSRMRTSTAAKTDVRIRIMNEIVAGMRIIKMYAWELPFSTLVGDSRKEEIHVIRKTHTLRAINMSLFYTSSKFIIFLTLLTYVLTGDGSNHHQLDAEKVFVTLSLYNNVRLIMTLFFPNAVSQLAETLVSIKRIQTFLLMEEQSPTTSSPSISAHPPLANGSIQFTNFSANWTKEQPTLENITFFVKENELVAIVGHVGSGKTSILQGILGELPPTTGSVRFSGTVAYTSQEPWVFSGSVRQNILFGRAYNEERYGQVVEACALGRDLELLPHGDHTLVGDKGSSLSGGQKARLSLARAVYSEADIYLLDDPLSAVDAEVGRHLFEKCICGILSNKTRILVTHQLELLKSLEKIILLEEGRLKGQGNYTTISSINPKMQESLSKGGPGIGFSSPLRDRMNSASSGSSIPLGLGGSSSLLIGTETNWGSTYSIHELDVALDEGDSEEASGPDEGMKIGDGGNAEKLLREKNAPELGEEAGATGGIKAKLYLKYFGAGSNWWTGFLLIFSNIVTQVLYTGSDWWLNYWTHEEEKHSTKHAPKEGESRMPPSTRDNIYIYCGIIGALFLVSMCRTTLFFRICMNASQHLHESMFLGLIRSPMRFFEVNPVGRILNRITKDIGCVDEVLPPTLFDTIEIFLQIIGIIIIVGIVSPLLLCPAGILILIFYFFRRYYIRTARSVKRLEGITRSPVFSQLSTSLYGLTTIRAFKAETQLIKSFDDFQDMHSSAWFVFISTTRWFGIWLDWISVSFILIVTYSFMFTAGSDDGAKVGLAVSSAMTLTGMLQWGVRQSCESENQMVSVERVMEYTVLPSEAEFETPKDLKPPINWPSHGEICFQHVGLRYGAEDHVLNDLTFTVKASEKVGVVGRTGAGKSSLISALFRIAEPTGSISIDGVDVLRLGLHDLRSKLSIIPQEPVLFTGTLRKNLDPFSVYRDDELWSSLEDVQLAGEVKKANLGLEMEIFETGSNFSVGQRQLVCLARAILKKNRILLLDEATANVDRDTDNLIQKTIRTKFTDFTCLTVAHRLHTVMDCDKMLVLDAGRVVEFDEPYTLLQNTSSALYSLAVQSGSLDILIKIAKDAALNKRLAFVEQKTS